MTSYPNKTLVCCGFCGHWCNRDHSEYPLEDTPPEKICVRLATEEFLCCALIQVAMAILFIVFHLLKLNARQKNIN